MNYALEIERRLNIKNEIDGCQKLFNAFVSSNALQINDELDTLRALKLFLQREEKSVRQNNKYSNIRNYDCLTLAIIACLLASRLNYNIQIGKPNILSRYYHSVLITSDQKMFKLTGKRRNYGFEKLSTDTIVQRIFFLNPIFHFFDFILCKT